VILCLKDSNAKTRDVAYRVLMLIASRVGTEETIRTFAAALGAETPHMRSAGVMAFSRLVFEFAWKDEELQTQLPSLLETVLVLMNEVSREVVKSVIGFIRVCVAAIPAESLAPLLPELVGSLMTNQTAKDRFRPKVKIILKKLVKRYGYDTLMPLVPPSETRLLTHMRKLEQRQKRKKDIRKRDAMEANDFEDMLGSVEEDSEDGRTLTSRMTGASRLTGWNSGAKSMVSRSKAISTNAPTKNGRSAILLSEEADGEVVDMLGSKVQRQVTFAEDQADDTEDSFDGMMEFDDDGKLVVYDGVEAKASAPVADDNLSQRLNKRRRYNSSGSAKESQGPVAGQQKDKKQNRRRDLGAAYKSKKAGGDVKKKNQKYEPYAFVPLDGRQYSKKNRRSTVDQMSSVVRTGGKRKRR